MSLFYFEIIRMFESFSSLSYIEASLHFISKPVALNLTLIYRLLGLIRISANRWECLSCSRLPTHSTEMDKPDKHQSCYERINI
jgi:hypothetical protein